MLIAWKRLILITHWCWRAAPGSNQALAKCVSFDHFSLHLLSQAEYRPICPRTPGLPDSLHPCSYGQKAVASSFPLCQAQPIRKKTLAEEPGRRSVVLDADPRVMGLWGHSRGFPEEGTRPTLVTECILTIPLTTPLHISLLVLLF